jgi:hypothetical protein
MTDIVDELRQMAGKLISGTVQDGESPSRLLVDAADVMEELMALARGAVEEYPVASGLWIDSDGRDGYGNLRALRLFLKETET